MYSMSKTMPSALTSTTVPNSRCSVSGTANGDANTDTSSVASAMARLPRYIATHMMLDVATGTQYSSTMPTARSESAPNSAVPTRNAMSGNSTCTYTSVSTMASGCTTASFRPRNVMPSAL